MPELITITECPRDAFQGLEKFIPSEDKIAYLNMLTKAGVRRIDFGSFVSPKAVPQMADTAVVFENMKKPSDLYLIAIIGNMRGLEGLLACNGKFKHKGRIAAAGYPLSVNETFQERNLGRSLDQSWGELGAIVEKATSHKIDMIVYLSMAFGNPYGDQHGSGKVLEFVSRLVEVGVSTISFADTIGSADPEEIHRLFQDAIAAHQETTFTAHFHSLPDRFAEKIDAAVSAGCRMIDSAIGGIGGCPFAKDELTANVDTLALLNHLQDKGFSTSIDPASLADARAYAMSLARKHSAS